MLETTTETVRIEGEFNATDLENLKQLARTIPAQQRLGWIWLALIALLVAFPFYAKELWARWIPAGAGIALFILVWGRDQWRSNFGPFLGKSTVVHLGESGVRVESPDGSSQLSWEAFSSCHVGPQMVGLMIGPNVGVGCRGVGAKPTRRGSSSSR
jgi:hypothetical protein